MKNSKNKLELLLKKMDKTELIKCCKNDSYIQNTVKTVHKIVFKTLSVQSELSCKIGAYQFYYDEIFDELTKKQSTLIKLMRSRWCLLQEIVLNNTIIDLQEILTSREFLSKSFQAILISLLQLDFNEESRKNIINNINLLVCSLVPLNKLAETVLTKVKFSRIEICPYFHYLHSLYEIYLNIIAICCLIEQKECLEKYLGYIFRNLIILYKTNNEKEMSSCFSHFWLMIQLLIEKCKCSVNFWASFNDFISTNEDPLISLGLLNKFSLLQCFNNNFEFIGSNCERILSNYTCLEGVIKQFLNSEPNSEKLLTSLGLIEPLICDLWFKDAKIDIYSTIWEFYSKRLNVSNKNCKDISTISFLKNLDTILYSHKDCKEDFDLFIAMLLMHLNKYPTHWNRIKGRIYSQLGPNKSKDLTEIGINHVITLYLALSTIWFKELEKKLIHFLEHLPNERKYSIFIWNIHSALIIKYLKQGHSIEIICQPMCIMLDEASKNQKLFYLIKHFIENLRIIIDSNENMQLYQWLLFDTWLSRYQSVCYYSDLINSLDVISTLLEKFRNNADLYPLWESFFKDILYINLKQLALSSNSLAIIGKIAGKLAISYSNINNDAFTYFTSSNNNNSVSSSILSNFLNVILENYPLSIILTVQQENVSIQTWINVCFLNLDSPINLTNNILKLDTIPFALKNQLRDSVEPILIFINYLSENSRNILAKNEKIVNLCELAFLDLDKCLLNYLKNPDLNEQIVLQIYKYAALLFEKCNNLIYNSNKPVTILTKLTHVLFFPIDFLTGRKMLHNFILNAIQQYWTEFFGAFIVLNHSKDLYLERTLKNMILTFLPHFSSLNNNPIVNAIINDTKSADVIFEKFNQAYFKASAKIADANVLKALKIVSDIAQCTNLEWLFKLLLEKTLNGLFELVIFRSSSQRSCALSTIKHITNSRLFSLNNREIFKTKLLEITETHMALNAINYFELIICLTKFIPDLMQELLAEITAEVGVAERLRGVGFDKTLRLHLERFQNSLGYT